MMKQFHKAGIFAVTVVVALLFTACRTSRTTGGGDVNLKNTPLREVVDRISANRLTTNYITAKLSVKAQAGNKSISLGGSLKMKRDDVIQLSLTAAFGLIEAGRMEFTPEYMMIVDRLNHRYVKADYDAIPFLSEAQINFDCFQALFWNELYVPGTTKLPKYSDFTAEEMGDNVLTLSHDQGTLAYRFIVNMLDGLLTQTCVGRNQQMSGTSLQWQYVDFTKVDNHVFPTKMDISLQGRSQPFGLSLSLNNVKHDSQWETRTRISTDKYQQVDVETLLNKLLK